MLQRASDHHLHFDKHSNKRPADHNIIIDTAQPIQKYCNGERTEHYMNHISYIHSDIMSNTN